MRTRLAQIVVAGVSLFLGCGSDPEQQQPDAPGFVERELFYERPCATTGVLEGARVVDSNLIIECGYTDPQIETVEILRIDVTNKERSVLFSQGPFKTQPASPTTLLLTREVSSNPYTVDQYLFDIPTSTPSQVLSNSQTSIDKAVVHNGFVYWFSRRTPGQTGHALMRVQIDTGSVEEFVDVPGFIKILETTTLGAGIYFVGYTDTDVTVGYVDLDQKVVGTSYKTPNGDLAYFTFLAAHRTRVLWSNLHTTPETLMEIRENEASVIETYDGPRYYIPGYTSVLNGDVLTTGDGGYPAVWASTNLETMERVLFRTQSSNERKIGVVGRVLFTAVDGDIYRLLGEDP